MQTDKENLVQTHVTLANATELAACVFANIAGEEISNKIDGELMDGELLREVVSAKLQSKFSSVLGG